MNNMTKTNKLLIILGLFILTLIALFYVEKNLKNNSVVEVTIPETTNVIYYCQEGELRAVYEKNDVIVAFPDKRILTLNQSVSADGARYESGQIVFWGKGDNAFVTENDKTTFSNCVTGEKIKGDNGLTTYINSSKLFSFIYPTDFNLYGGDVGYTPDWRVNGNNSGILFNIVAISKSYMPNTNFSDGKFTVGVSADPEAVKNCLKIENGAKIESGKVAFGGKNFTKIVSVDAGAGNFYDTTSYRTINDGQCYAIEYTIHSTNIGNHSPDQGIKEFDKAKITSVLEGIAESFKFL